MSQNKPNNQLYSHIFVIDDNSLQKEDPLRKANSQWKVDTLLPFLYAQLSKLGRNTVKAMLARGQITVNGQVTTAYNHPLQPGDEVIVLKHAAKVETSPLSSVSLLYEDDDLIIIHKEANLLSVGTPTQQADTAVRQLTDYVRLSHPRARIFTVHRLDRDTSGIMMFAKNGRTQQALQNNWTDLVSKRAYVAIVEGTPHRTEGTIKSWLKENKAFHVYSSLREGDGQLAITHYKVVEMAGKSGSGAKVGSDAKGGSGVKGGSDAKVGSDAKAGSAKYAMLEVELETGRKNQIRVHLQDIGHPIIGDDKYGSRTNPIKRLGLHAFALHFTHPTTKKELRFTAPIPSSFRSLFPHVPKRYC